MADEPRRFACTACGKCCDRGPEIELSEAAAFADTFVTSMIFRVHSLPIDARSGWAASWWQSHGARIPISPALEEQRRHLGHFASRRRAERCRDRQLFLTISAIVDDDGRGRCPALSGNLCSIYQDRPLTCRTVPLHYSRPPSALGNYLDYFTHVKDYECDTTHNAPVVLERNTIIDPVIANGRDRAIVTAKTEKTWKDHIIALMVDDEKAEAARLPTYDEILRNSDNGSATLVPIIVAWRVARDTGLLTSEFFYELCQKQIVLIKSALNSDCNKPLVPGLLDSLAVYQAELKRAR